MNSSKKTIVLCSLAALVIGLLIGFIPEHIANSSLQQKLQDLTDGNVGLQGHLNQAQNQLRLSEFTVRSASVLEAADQNDYSIASAAASSLFTDLRKYVDGSGDRAAAAQLSQVLAVRDRTIAGLARADPGTKQLLLEIFQKTKSVSSQAMQDR